MEKTYPMAFVTAPGRIEYRDRKRPELHAHGVLIKTKAVSICGGDLHIFKGKHPAAPLPVPIGHEVSGEVLHPILLPTKIGPISSPKAFPLKKAR